MENDARDLKLIVLTVVAVLVGLVLTAIGVYTRDSIGSFASWLIMSAGIVIALAISASWRQRRNRDFK